MKVSETNVNFGRQAYVKEVSNTPPPQDVAKSQPAENKKEMAEDKVSLSSSAKDMKIASEAVAAAPDVRQEKVYEIKAAVDNGNYQINAERIANKMLGYNIDEMV
jgi:negative regulator of flagellin synthesis FlgM